MLLATRLRYGKSVTNSTATGRQFSARNQRQSTGGLRSRQKTQRQNRAYAQLLVQPELLRKDWEATSKYAESLPASLRNVDYAFLSIYEAVCTPAQHPSSNDLARTFNHFKGQFSKATKFGIGEIGTQDESDEQKPATLEEKKRIANYYYGLQQPLYAKMGEPLCRRLFLVVFPP